VNLRPPPVESNVVDRVVSFFNPIAGMKRIRARAALTWLSGWDGGGYDAGRSDSKALQRYNPRGRSAVADIHPGLDKMRARSRDQARNNPLATGAVNTAVTSTVGSGLSCQPAIDQDFLGLTDDEADAWEREAQRVWELWANTTECDIEDELNFGQLQSLAFRAVLESGDILRVRRFLYDQEEDRPLRGDAFGTKVQFVEADRISNPHHTWDTDRVQGGVAVDADGRTLGYHVQTAHPGDALYRRGQIDWRMVPAYSPATGQRVAQLLLDKTRPGQRRGVPYLAPVIESLKQLERYTEAELMAAVVSAIFTVFIKHEGAADTSPLSGLAGEGDEATKPEPGIEGDLFLGNGAVVDLAPEESIETADPTRPNQAFDPFVLSILRQIGTALELPFEILVKHFSSSYSASRGALLEAWKFYRTRRTRLVTWLCQPCYEDVISEAVARGILEAPGFFEDPLVRRAWLGAVWTGDAMPQIDPLKEAKAAGERVDRGFSTIDRECREINGTSFIANHTQRRKEARMRREDGLDVESVADATVTETVESPDDDRQDVLLAGGAQ